MSNAALTFVSARTAIHNLLINLSKFSAFCYISLAIKTLSFRAFVYLHLACDSIAGLVIFHCLSCTSDRSQYLPDLFIDYQLRRSVTSPQCKAKSLSTMHYSDLHTQLYRSVQQIYQCISHQFLPATTYLVYDTVSLLQPERFQFQYLLEFSDPKQNR